MSGVFDKVFYPESVLGAAEQLGVLRGVSARIEYGYYLYAISNLFCALRV